MQGAPTTTQAHPPGYGASAPASLRKVATSVLVGTTIEWYDFTLYAAAAATVFGPVFFPSENAVTGTLLSFATFAVGFFARPLGGLVVGHFGDRVGRKKMLVLSLTLMGISTLVMGLIPSYHAIGVAAPLALVACRLVQGFGVGGEWGGAVLTAVEHAPPHRRAFYGSLPQVGVPAGLLLSTLALLAVNQLPEQAFLSWGWRIPFLASGILVAVGLYIRLKVAETPVFERVIEREERVRLPAVAAIRRYPKELALMIVVSATLGVYYYSVTTFSLSYATSSHLLSRSNILVALCTAAVVMIFALLYFGTLAQRLGRQPLVRGGFLLVAVWVFPVFLAIRSGSVILTVLAFAVHAVLFSVTYAAMSTFITERFAPDVRFSASSIAFQFGSVVGAFTPMIAVALTNATGSVFALCSYASVAAVIGFLATSALGPDPVDADN